MVTLLLQNLCVATRLQCVPEDHDQDAQCCQLAVLKAALRALKVAYIARTVEQTEHGDGHPPERTKPLDHVSLHHVSQARKPKSHVKAPLSRHDPRKLCP